jgi:hypothetical protein
VVAGVTSAFGGRAGEAAEVLEPLVWPYLSL